MKENLKTTAKRRIVVSVTNDLLTDQRVQRTCDALYAAGYMVELVGRNWPDGRRLVKPYRCVKMRLIFHSSVLFYAEYNLRLFFKLLISRADAFYANDTDTLLASGLAARIRRKPLLFDAHELFPDVPELMGRSFVRKIWRVVEKRCVPRAKVCITVCESVANEYFARYGVKFGVVRNLSDNVGEVEVGGHRESEHVLIYQGAVNVGRCVKEIIDAMEYVTDYQLVVAGIGDQYEAMRQYAVSRPYQGRIKMLGRVSPKDLHQLTKRADLGFCVMENMGLNYYYSLPNRISDYVAAEVPVLASDFPEIRRVVEKYRIGKLVDQETIHNPQLLAQSIKETLCVWEKLDDGQRKERFVEAREELSWKREKEKLLGYVDALF